MWWEILWYAVAVICGILLIGLGITLYDKGIWPKWLRGEQRIGLAILIVILVFATAMIIIELP
jgi:hypothetical protein